MEEIYFLVLKKYINKRTHEAIKNKPPIGVIIPIILKSKAVNELVDKK
jgi:hypothetical protein